MGRFVVDFVRAMVKFVERDRSVRRLLALLFSVLLSVACGATPRRPDVILITVDTLRADRLGCYGDAQARTPHLDALAARGVRFTRASAVAPITLPAHASLFTGRYPAAHGVRDNGAFALDERERTLAEILTEHGYRCGAFVGAFVLAYRFGLGQGFATYDDRFEGPGAIEPPLGSLDRRPSERRASAVTDAALAWLERQPADEPVFLWVHYFDPHADYAPPEPFFSQAPDRYRGEIAYTDAHIGRLLEGLRRRPNRGVEPLIVVVADHGEAFGEHGEEQHGFFVYEPTIHIPLLFSWRERLPQGAIVEEAVSQVDVMPTVLALLGIEAPPDVQGVDLSPLLEGRSAGLSRSGILIESLLPRLEFGWSELYALRAGDLKYVEAPRPELYALDEDPLELHNRVAAEPDRAREARAVLLALRDRVARPSGAATAAPADAEVAARLRALGYLTGEGGKPVESEGSDHLADPKDRLHIYLETKRAHSLLVRGRYTQAMEVLEALLRNDPNNIRARSLLAESWIALGDDARAARVLQELLERAPEWCEAWTRLGEIEARSGRGPEAAAAAYRRSLECNPAQPEVHARLAAVLFERGQSDQALEELGRGLALDPGNADLHRLAAEIYERQGALAEAREHWLHVLRLQPESAEVLAALGLVEARLGYSTEAKSRWRRALELDPADAVARANLGTLLLREGNWTQGIEQLREALERDPSLDQARFTLAMALIRAGELEAARDELSRYAEAQPRDARGWVQLARAFEARGDAASARACWERALQAEPQNPAAHKALGRNAIH